MSYLLVFNNYDIYYLDTYKFLDTKKHLVGRIDTETDVLPDVYFSPELNSIGRKQGYIQSRYGHLYYTESSNHFPTRFNNHSFSDETFPISNSGNIYNVFTFIHQDGYPIGFMFLVENQNWDFHQLDGTDVIIGSEPHREIFLSEDKDLLVLENTPERFLNLTFIDDHYFIQVSKEEAPLFYLIDDNNNMKNLTENMRLDPAKTYRFLYREEYMFIIGGDILLYGKL
ncbi:MAG: hypothetical protein E7F06_01495 [Lachnospiraceae bacterium]|nr:hypothetical protein [Lachnospiraceae bacterium]